MLYFLFINRYKMDLQIYSILDLLDKNVNKLIDRIGDEILKKSFHEIKDELEPLSILLFRGSDLYSKMIRDVESIELNNEKIIEEYGLFSHCGCLINKKLFPNVKNMQEGKWYVYEMTLTSPIFGDTTPDIESGSGKFGLQIRDFESVLNTYPGRIVIIKLRNNPILQRENESNKEFEDRLNKLYLKSQKFHDLNKNLLYQMDPLRLIASVFSKFRFIRKLLPFSKYWKMCSTTLTYYLQYLEILDKNINSEDIIPEDFIYDSNNELKQSTFILPPIEITKNLNKY
jgi:hypothetical protein